MLFIVRDARSMGLSAGGAGSVCCCCGRGCDIDAWRVKPGLLGAGVLTNAPGVGRCGVAGAIWKAMMGCAWCGRVALVQPGECKSFRWWLGGRAGDLASTLAARKCLKVDENVKRVENEIKNVPFRNCDAAWGGSSGTSCKSTVDNRERAWRTGMQLFASRYVIQTFCDVSNTKLSRLHSIQIIFAYLPGSLST
jgi:hypothetical protein